MTALIARWLGISIPTWVVEVIAVLALLGAGVLYFEHRGASRELAKLEKSSTALIARAQSSIAAEVKKHAADNVANQEKLRAALDSNSTLQSQLVDSVRNFDAYRRAHSDVARSSSGPVPTPDRECGARSCGDIAQELAVRGNELAGSIGELSASLQACERDRDSLTGLPQ